MVDGHKGAIGHGHAKIVGLVVLVGLVGPAAVREPAEGDEVIKALDRLECPPCGNEESAPVVDAVLEGSVGFGGVSSLSMSIWRMSVSSTNNIAARWLRW